MQKNREDTDVLNAKGFRGTWKTTAQTAVQEWMVMKMRLIDADALKEIISGNSYILRDSINSMNFGMFWEGIEQAIDESPTVDAVPVEVVADMFGEVPCNYAFCASQGDGYIQVDDFMYEHCDGWCEDKCGEVPMIECWKRFFKALVERRNNEID